MTAIFVRWLEEQGGIVVFPSHITAKHPKKTDWHTYKERHLVEKLFLKLKTTAVLPPGMRRKHSIFTLLSVLPVVALFGCFDGFKTDSSAVSSFSLALAGVLTAILFPDSIPLLYKTNIFLQNLNISLSKSIKADRQAD